MLKDITLGQFLPGNSLLHRLDPRTKIMLTIVFIIVLFTVNNVPGLVLSAAFVMLFIHLSSVPLKLIVKSIKPIMFFVLLTAVLNIFMTDGTYLFKYRFIHISVEGIYSTVIMALRLVLLVAGTSLLTYTTSPIVLTDGIESLLGPLEKIRFPSHELAMMMTIALRFIPTIIEETDKIIKAQSARGADFDTGGLIKKAKAMIPLLIPLFVNSFKRADELALAMECRGYHGGKGRTKLKQLKFTKLDLAALVLFALICALCIFVGRYDFSKMYSFLK